MAEHVADNRPKKKPGWMSIPGGPKEPNLTEFRAKLQAKSAEKTKCFDRLNEIRDMFQTKPDDVDRNLARSEQQKLRDRMREIETERRKERDGRNAKDTELKSVRNQRRALEDQLKELLGDLKGLKTLEDIEEAIDRVMYKLETSSGDLATEKKTVKRLGKLEEAKALVLQLQPLQEGVTEAEERESELQAEFKEIHERIATLNKQYEEQAKVKEAKDKEVKKTPGPDRAAVQKERDDIRAKIATINNDMDEIRKKFDTSREEWNKWREVAMEKYRKQVEDERAERAARFAERDKQRKQERKLARALKKLNPYENEIDACTSLIRYLEDKTTVTKRNQDEVAKKKKAAAFDPKTFCPDGAHLAHAEEEESWVFGDRTKKQQKQPAKPAKKEEKPSADDKKAPAKDRYLQHTVDKFRSFELVKVETPMTMAQVPAVLEELKKKKKEYESHKKTKEQILEEATSSDEEAEEGEGEAQE